MVWSRPHHLRHQWPQISTFASLNHIHHHTYFKSPYVNIQEFHILHHHTMKLLQAFKSFLPGGSIVENWQRNWFTTGHTIQLRKLIRCRSYSSATKTGSLSAPQFSSENCFAAGTTISVANAPFVAANTLLVANANSLQATRFRQRITLLLQIRQWTQIHCRQENFATKLDSLRTTQI